ncbi:chloride channel protein [Ancylobacter oerskovii]|uniref:Chloride channel protein n=1 Tax=Ancylobacter oerskovii TaxID=459519 RepID=A0ABW4YXV2_9HYPH|nr:chloride channel protein [Ancylobacter oerskovii]MBS7541842.1 chloride channel protein [Ancylobacter oerskovii]
MLVRLRMGLRESEFALVALAAAIGVLAGLVVVAMGAATQFLHVVLFGIAPDAHLSVTAGVAPLLLVLVPALGGLVFGLASQWIRRGAASAPVDPIEANALQGGRMSLKDSVVVAVQTLFSSGVGASVGLEAGYTQGASGIASFLGQRLHLRRADLRTLVGCAAGAAIGAAFDAPLMGAFYGFELIIGTYAIPAFVPMMTASFTAAVTRRLLAPEALPVLAPLSAPGLADLPAVLLLGAFCALAGIAVMRGATLVEAGFRRVPLPVALRPALGGLAVGMMALASPTVLSAGHGAVYHFLAADALPGTLALLLLAKMAASSISIGSGFRGGLFFASLLMGVLAGRSYAAALALALPALPADVSLYGLIGMSALAVSVVGGPMTMTLLALEMTGDLNLTLAVLAASGVSSLMTRRLFGFSFATWRFHLRGESIRGAYDIGWLRELTVGELMRSDVPRLAVDMSPGEARRLCPPGATADLVATEADGRYAGMVPPAALYAAEGDAPATLRPLLRLASTALTPGMTIREALAAFEGAEAEALAVVVDDGSRRVVGLLSETRAIRRYSAEMSRRLGEITGEKGD